LGESCASPLSVGSECFLQAGGRTLVVRVLGVANDLVWASYPAGASLAEGDGVQLEIAVPGGGSMGYHMRVAARPTRSLGGILLERVESSVRSGLRRDWRVPVDLAVWLKDVYQEEPVKAMLRDLSSDGASAVSRGHFDPGDLISMTFRLPGYPVHKLVGRVVYRDSGSDRPRIRYGIQFAEMENRAREAVTWFLYEQIQERYRRDIRELYAHPGLAREKEEIPEAVVLETSEAD
jgi:hypothetical protein